MVDISKCDNEECTLKNTCYRFVVKSDDVYQWYSAFEYNKQTKTCDFYWEVKTKKTKK